MSKIFDFIIGFILIPLVLLIVAVALFFLTATIQGVSEDVPTGNDATYVGVLQIILYVIDLFAFLTLVKFKKLGIAGWFFTNRAIMIALQFFFKLSLFNLFD